MFLRFLERLRQTFGFRLTLWYSATFILSALTLFTLVTLVYLFISTSLERQDHELILSKLKEYQTQYCAGGIVAILKQFDLEKQAGKPNPFFIRVANPANNTLFLNTPRQRYDSDLKQLENRLIPEETWTHLLGQDNEVLEIATVLLPDGSILQVGKDAESREELFEGFRGIFVGVTLSVIMLGVMGGQFLTIRTLKPIRHLIQMVRTMAATGNLAARMPSRHSGDELDELAGLINQMLAKIETLITKMRETLDNVAHDLRTPMTRLRGIAEAALQGDGNPETCREALADCLEESDRVLRMMNTLMDISEAETGTMHLAPELVNLPELMGNVIELYQDIAEDKQIAIRTTYPRKLYLTADRDRLRQALANLLDNAVKYTPNGSAIEIKAYARQQEIVITVSDRGPGIPPEEIPRIWDRLYRGDKSRSQRGLGLGLSLVKAIIEAHHGHVEVSSEPGAGSVFAVYLPRSL